MIENIPYELSIMADAVNYRRELLRLFEPHLGSHILEIGGGIGFFSEMLAAREATEHLCVIEPDPICRAKLEDRHLHVEICSGTAFDLEANDSFCSVVSINVLEHIEEDAAELCRYIELLKPGGCLCLFVPARKELYSEIDELFGHYRRYEKIDIIELLSHAGFAIETVRYFNMVGYFLWWFSFVVMRKENFNSQMVKAFDRFIFPVTSRMERLITRTPFGQNLFVVARRPIE